MCGIVGFYGPTTDRATEKLNLLLAKLQNRGPQGAGVVTYDHDGQIHELRGAGSVEAVFDGRNKLDNLPGYMGVGQVRYATFGYTIQPITWIQRGKQAALAHNGEFANAITLRKEAEEMWEYKFQSTSDTEVLIPYLMHSSKDTFRDALLDVLQNKIKGAYSMIILYDGKLYCVRDPHGFRPLALGISENASIVASESSAIEVLGGQYIGDVNPAQLIVIGPSGIIETVEWAEPKPKSCIFEHVYFANPDSYVGGINVSLARDFMGKLMFEEAGWIDADVIVPVLDSGLHAALGFYEATLRYAFQERKNPIPLKAGVHRSWFIGRSFQEGEQIAREILQRIKSNVIAAWVKDKRVIVIDDSLVRGTVMRIIVELMRIAGAREVHVIIPSPPPIAPCAYGIDTYEDELIAARLNGNVHEIQQFIGADSLRYLSLDALYQAVTESASPPVRTTANFCDACYTGQYPVPFEQDRSTKPRRQNMGTQA